MCKRVERQEMGRRGKGEEEQVGGVVGGRNWGIEQEGASERGGDEENEAQKAREEK